MFDNSSTSSLTSLSDGRPERKRHQMWRKPVPQYVPDPPKKPSLLGNTAALRRMALLTSGGVKSNQYRVDGRHKVGERRLLAS